MNGTTAPQHPQHREQAPPPVSAPQQPKLRRKISAPKEISRRIREKASKMAPSSRRLSHESGASDGGASASLLGYHYEDSSAGGGGGGTAHSAYGRCTSCSSSAASLEEIRASIQVLLEAQRRSLEREANRSGGGGGEGHSEEDFDESDAEEADEAIDLERTCVRMDGLEVYAVVSALTVATSLSVAEAYRHDSDARGWVDMYQDGQHVELLCRSIFLMCSAASALLGLHATLVFSLITMYGRTAVGVDNMPAFRAFYDGTAGQRFRGFRAFLFSIYAFLAQIVLVVTAKCPEHNRLYPLMGFILASAAVLQIYRDTEHIVGKAGIIFAPRIRPNRPKLKRN